ncbi:hypothetical protein evm_002435 [Chilo suppressalis]|nr:hypothetical protein evm_002435 [Chilo suppressalis]
MPSIIRCTMDTTIVELSKKVKPLQVYKMTKTDFIVQLNWKRRLSIGRSLQTHLKCDVQLNEFLRSIKKDPSKVDFQAMINILITHAQSPEELLQHTAVQWLQQFVQLAGARLLPHASGVLAAVLPCLAYPDNADNARRSRLSKSI